MSYSITKSLSGDDVVTTRHHVIHVYDRAAGRALVRSNSVETWEEGTPGDGDRELLRSLIAGDADAIAALVSIGAIDPFPARTSSCERCGQPADGARYCSYRCAVGE